MALNVEACNALLKQVYIKFSLEVASLDGSWILESTLNVPWP